MGVSHEMEKMQTLRAFFNRPRIPRWSMVALLLVLGLSAVNTMGEDKKSARSPTTTTLGSKGSGKPQSSYQKDLAQLYNEHQRVVALWQACEVAVPERKDAIEQAYRGWAFRHQQVIDDLENRFAAMIKHASKDADDYAKNYGFYQTEVFQMRESQKKSLLANPKKLALQCAFVADYLQNERSDLPILFPAEFHRIYPPR